VRLLLVRHAEAEPGEPDELRALTAHGRWQAQDLAKRLEQHGIRVEAVLSSPLLRARQTADAIAAGAGVAAEPDERLAPGATADDLRAAVAGRGQTVVVVGHQPDCGQIAAALGDGVAPDFPAGGVHEFEL